ncbi:MAG: hypothetical protein J6B43_11150 [Lachnospiraceae bacterium]|nr:hypothetical protein [Lachnospiraceae bacterium]
MDSVVVYNRYANGLMETEYYVGTRFDNVRVELTKGANIRESGMENADSCLVKIPNNGTLPRPYKAPQEWIALTDEEKLEYFTLDPESSNFFVIVKKGELGINIDLPAGLVNSADYKGGFYQFIRNKYGYTYTLKTADVYNLIPRFEVSGA